MPSYANSAKAEAAIAIKRAVSLRVNLMSVHTNMNYLGAQRPLGAG